jgi:H/ACA ribonucleoprotein complex subunit 3
MNIYITGKLHRLSPDKSIGKGGEADVYDLGNGQVAKIFKAPDHPDFDGLPDQQKGAELRIKQHQTKLKAFPKNLPNRVVSPIDLVTDKSGQIIGYTMPFLKGTHVLLQYAERSFRSSGINNEQVVKIFRDLHSTVAGVHKAKVTIGDFNDLNVLVSGEQAHIIDADSFQYDKYPCMVFTARFVDPCLCDRTATSPHLIMPHNALSDWYAYNVMLFQCLLYVHPYGGVYKPKDPKKRVVHDARPLKRITVFDPEVKYPKPATSYEVLSDDLLHHFHQVFMKDHRVEFPEGLLEMQWTNCPKCGLEFARRACPVCATPAPGAVKEVIAVRGKVTSEKFFQTHGKILYATVQNSKLLYLYHEDGKFKREGGKIVTSGTLDPLMRFRIKGDATLIAQGQHGVELYGDDRQDSSFVMDTYNQIPVFDANQDTVFWVHNGTLYKEGSKTPDPEVVGKVLQGQTMFWVGEKMGFGFYRAGMLSMFFMFSTTNPGINDTVRIPPIRGQLLDSTCYFGHHGAVWFAISVQDNGVIKNHIYNIGPDGKVVASAEGKPGDDEWLDNIRGKMAVGSGSLFSVTDDGLVRLLADKDKGEVWVQNVFPDAEPFVDERCHLFPGPGGLYVVSAKDIRLLKMR